MKKAKKSRLENAASCTTVTHATLSPVQGESGAPGENGAPGPMVSSAAPHCLDMETKICCFQLQRHLKMSWTCCPHTGTSWFTWRERPSWTQWCCRECHSLTTYRQPERLELANFSCADLFRAPVVTMACPVLPVPQ